MTDQLTDLLLTMLTATTLEATVAVGIEALKLLVQPSAAALLLWDDDLARYIVGDVFAENAPQFRRDALRAALAAFQQNSADGRCIEQHYFYQPLNTPDGNHVAAYLYEIIGMADPERHPSGYDQLMRATIRALWTMTRIEQADREHAQLIAEQARLEQILQAVAQQQQTIDRLLTLERQFSASLEAKVEERTRALREAQVRIIQSEKLAVIGQLAGSLAHVINNPVQAMQSGLGLIVAELESGQVAESRSDLRVIQAELDRIQTIFRQMLDFQRPAAHERTPLDLNAICEGVRVLMRKKLQEAQVDLSLDLADDLPRTCGDSNQIKQVLINLILNAAEAMPEQGGQVSLITRFGEAQVLLSVRDNGGGIPLEHQPHLFEPLFTTKTRGLGLGLAISQEIAHRHHGELEVQSQPAKGTIFTLRLPIEEECHDS